MNDHKAPKFMQFNTNEAINKEVVNTAKQMHPSNNRITHKLL